MVVKMSKHRIEEQLSHISNILGKIQFVAESQYLEHRRSSHPNPLSKAGAQTFSQSDEDGVTLEILQRLAMNSGSYLEIGVENGTQCNTLILALLGWRGVWVDQCDLCYEIPNPERLQHIKQRVDVDNVLGVTNRGLELLGSSSYDVVSVDVDGNDYYLCDTLLSSDSFRPSLIIVEYNADFVPPAQFIQPYSADYAWGGSNYYGASLQSMTEMMKAHGYRLVACNAGSGCNAFYVLDTPQTREAFSDVPTGIRDLYVAPFYSFCLKLAHGGSIETVRRALS